MALRTGHGNGAGVPRVEVLPANELPAGVPAPAGQSSVNERGTRGRFAPGNKESANGGRARAGATRLARRMGLASLDADPVFAPYKRSAADFRRAQVTTLARTVGGGHCGPAPSSIIASAAWQLAASRFLFDTAAGDVDKLTAASKLANDSRQNLLAAHELCAKEAQARAVRPDPHASLSQAFGAPAAASRVRRNGAES
ncbi:MAG: hypothetical protein ACOY0T_30035 [Myxococcota bacterium]